MAEDQIATTEMKKFMIREKDRLKKQKRRQRQRSLGDIKLMRENEQFKRKRRRKFISDQIEVKNLVVAMSVCLSV